ncbi:hypothetical protein [Polaromonas jejuensis]|uniref:Uncharacterized protein n=1 Tax=Polaromonas jejuensis TaxID=457502 RepID=A0ABW0QKW3_9BURK|nr:hypothetical protein [Polaromonas jejuensis]
MNCKQTLMAASLLPPKPGLHASTIGLGQSAAPPQTVSVSVSFK